MKTTHDRFVSTCTVPTASARSRSSMLCLLVSFLLCWVLAGSAARATTFTAGYATDLGSTGTAGSDYLLAVPVTVSQRGVLTHLGVIFKPQTGTPQGRLAVYTNNAGAPGALLAETGVFACSGSTQEVAPLAHPVLEPGQYWLGTMFSANTKTSYTIASGTALFASRPFSSGFPSSGGTFSSVTNQRYSWYLRLDSDTETLSPTLTAPAQNQVVASTINVSFTLPEAAQSGSVKLSFGTTVLTLAASQETSGGHSFTFNPANPTASPEIASGAPIPDGVYTVTLSYQDALGNLAVSDESTNVTIDTATLSPTLTAPAQDQVVGSTISVSFTLPEAAQSGSVKLSFGATALTLAASQETSGGHSFTFDPANPTASPEIANGAPIPDGVYTVTLSYQDALGNLAVSDESTNVTINTVVDPVFTGLYAKSGAVPGAGVDPRIGTGALFTTLYTPAINSDGTVAFQARWKAGKVTTAGIFAGQSLVVAVNDDVPGISGAKFKTFKDPVIDDNGHVAFIATIKGSSITTANDTVVVSTGRNGSIEVLAREGGVAPGVSGATFKVFQNVSIAGGESMSVSRPAANGAIATAESGTLFTATLAGAVSTANDSGAWWLPAGESAVEIMVREGDPVPGGTGTIKTFQVLKTLSGSPGQGRGLLHGSEALIQLASSVGGQQGIYSAVPGDLSAVARTGDVLDGTAYPDAQWQKLSLVSGSNTGNLSVLGELKRNTGGITTNTKGIFVGYNNGDSWEPAALIYDDAPGFSTGEKFYSFKDPVNAPDGNAVAFIGAAKGGTVTTATDSAIWVKFGSSPLTLVAREGAEPPDAPGARWKSFDSLALAGTTAGPLFTARLLVGAGDVTTANDVALYGVDSVGVLHTLLREGSSLLGKTVKTFSVLKAVPGSNGSTHSFNAVGKVVALVTYSDATTGIVSITLP